MMPRLLIDACWIKSSTNPDQWAYIASEDNPADHASRGLTAEQLKNSNWFSGLKFFWQQELPHRESKVGEVKDDDPKLCKAVVFNTKAKEDRSLLDRLEKFSDWSRVVQAVARLKRLIQEHKGVKERTNETTSLQERKGLTSNHILTMKATIILPPPGQFVREDLYLQKRWCKVQYLANEFWIRWRKEYLLSLQPRQKWKKSRRNLMMNDIVLLQDDQAPRSEWKLARVVFPSSDDRVRKVRLLVSDTTYDTKGKPRTIQFLDRPIHKVITLIEADQNA